MPKPKADFDYVGALLKYVQPPSSTTAVLPTGVDEEALARIFAAVGSEFTPAAINRNALWQAITEADENRRRLDQLRPGDRARTIVKSLGRTVVAAESLAALLKENPDVVELLAETVPAALTDLERLVTAAKLISEKLASSGIARGATKKRIPSATEWLAGVELPLIFEENFDRAAGRARNNGKPAGPTKRFIAAVFRELGVHVEDETVMRAISRLSELKEQRRAIRRRNHAAGQK